MNALNLTHLAMTCALLSVSACGGSEPEGPCGEEAVEQVAAPAAAEKTAPSGDLKAWTELDATALASYGERVFLAKGSNTCNDCHGKDGKKGRLEQAADLTTPSKWRANKVYGVGTPEAATAIAYLVSKGGKQFNGNFEKDNADAGWDWGKAEAASYDIQMFGVTQSSTQAEIKKIRKDLKKAGFDLAKSDMTAFGTKSVIAYLDTIAAE